MANDRDDYLGEALRLAEQGEGFAAPKPPAGVVLASDDNIIGTGYQINDLRNPVLQAIKAAEENKHATNGARLYCTLEPCPGTDEGTNIANAIHSAGIVDVIYSYEDPKGDSSGKSSTLLSQHKIKCTQVPFPAIDAFYQAYTHWCFTDMPWVTVKLAMSLDGMIAEKGGHGSKVTSKELFNFTHQQRKRSDAILTTARTVIHDNPKLTARIGNESTAKNIYIIDKALDVPLRAKVLDEASHATIFAGQNIQDAHKTKLVQKGVDVLQMQTQKDEVDLTFILKHIAEQGCHRLWVEAGTTLFEALINAKYANEAYIYIEPRCLGRDAFPGIRQAGLFSGAKDMSWHPYGHEVMCHILF